MAKSTPYRSLTAETRLRLVSHAMATHKEARALYAQRLVARGGGFRAVTLRTWPVEKLAREIVRLGAENAQDELELLQLLYVDLEPAIQITMLDAAGVGHEGGVITEGLEPPFTDAASVARGAAAVNAAHGEDGLRYLRTRVRYNLAAWPGLDEVLAGIDGGDAS